jgi:uncharacterized protein (UPF0147 family)
MDLKYNLDIDISAIEKNIKRLTNQIYKLLPNREENVDWKTPLTTIIEELSGMNRIFLEKQEILFSLICKLEGLFTLTEDKDFFLYRRTIFECLGLLNELKEECL